MSTEAWNKVTQTHDLFKKIIAPLKQHLGINFGYMIVSNDGSYYQIIEDLVCLKKWVTNVEQSGIFCTRNVTNYFDDEYNFTLWPNISNNTAMEVYHNHNMWNGITASKVNKDYTELYWFTKQNAENGWHKWFIRNKIVILKLIKYFDAAKEILDIQELSSNKELFIFKCGFYFYLPKAEYITEKFTLVTRSINSWNIYPKK